MQVTGCEGLWDCHPCLPLALFLPGLLGDEEEGGPVSLGLLVHLGIGGAVDQSRRPFGAWAVVSLRSDLPFPLNATTQERICKD